MRSLEVGKADWESWFCQFVPSSKYRKYKSHFQFILAAAAVEVELVNLSVHRSRPVVLQAGSFSEHSFGRVEVLDEDGQVRAQEQVEGAHFKVELQPGSQIKLRLGTRRHCNKPSFAFPWHGDAIPFR